MMKTKLIFMTVFLFYLMEGYSVKALMITPQPAAKRTFQDSAAIKELIDKGSYEFSVSHVTGQSLTVSSGYYFIRIDKGRAEAYLPFFGESKRVDFSGENGIIFNAPAVDYKLSRNEKKGYYSVSFKINEAKDHYIIYMDIFNQKNVSVRISSLNKSSMSYTGMIGEIRKNRQVRARQDQP